MRLPLLHRYIIKEIAAPFLTALLVFTGLLFLSKILKLLELVVSRDVSLLSVLKIFALIIPQFLELAFPMAFLLGLILAFGRLSGDSELVVMRASGISLRELIKPVALSASVVFVFALSISLFIRPWSNTELGQTLFTLAKQRLSSGLVAGVFNELGVLTIYAEQVEEGGSRLGNVLISDKRDEKQQRIFIAKYGQIFSSESNRTLNLRLFDGSIHEGRGSDYNITSFDSNSVTLSEQELLNDESIQGGKKATEMSLSELRTSISKLREQQNSIEEAALTKKQEKNLAKQLVEYHRRFALPFACVAVGLIGMVLGIQPSRGGKSWGLALNITVGILVITLYYFAMAFSTAMGEEAILAPWITMWIPNLIFMGLAYFLFSKMESEEWMAVSQVMLESIEKLVKRVRNKFA